jgi:L-iditol 2-dehydrogenase
MKAAVVHGANDIRFEEVPTPRAGPGEVVVQVKACGVCTTDLKILSGQSTVRGLPAILGHEVSGVICEIGAGVTGFNNNQRVAVYPIASCGDCFFCRRNKHSLCLHEIGLAHGVDGGFAEYVRIPHQLVNLGGVVPIEDSLPFDLAAVAEPLSCAISAVQSPHLENEWVAVVGAGPMGLMNLLAAKANGLRTVVIDLVPARLQKARELGATQVIDCSQDDPVQAVRTLTQVGAGLVVAAVGDINVIKQYLPMVRNGGTFNIFGGPPKGSSLTIDPRWLHYGEINLTGTFGSSVPDFGHALHLISTRKVDVAPLISERLPLGSLMDVIEKAKNLEGLKSVILF